MGSVALRILLPTATFAALIGLWWLATIVFDWPSYIVPTPLEVADVIVDRWSFLMSNFWTTLGEALLGFGFAIGIAVPFAVAITYSRVLELTIYPALVALNAVPKIAIAPLLVIWMGFGLGPKVVMVILICFFPIVISTTTGLKSTPAELVELSRSLPSSALQEFVRFRFPWSLPYLFVGLKVAITLAVIGAVVGEFVGATKGPRLRDRRLRAERGHDTCVRGDRAPLSHEHPALLRDRPLPAPRRSVVGGEARVSAIELQGVSHVFESRKSRLHALAGIDLEIRDNEFVTLVGRSGCGKSTLLRIIAGLLEPSAGEVRVAGTPVRGARSDLSFMFQRSALLPWRTVIENVMLPVEISGSTGGSTAPERRSSSPSPGSRGSRGVVPTSCPAGCSSGSRSVARSSTTRRCS